MWVAMALHDSCKRRSLACKINGGNSQPTVRLWLVEQPIQPHFYAVSSALPHFSLQLPFLDGKQYRFEFAINYTRFSAGTQDFCHTRS